MLKMLMLKKKQCVAIIYYKWKLSLSGKDDTKQAKSLIFTVFPICIMYMYIYIYIRSTYYIYIYIYIQQRKLKSQNALESFNAF